MRLTRGPRPATIGLSAALFLAQAALSFVYRISRLEATQADLVAAFPAIPVDRDLTIVVICARLTIALIPVALVWLFASRLARWFIPLMVVVQALSLVRDWATRSLVEPLPLAAFLLSLAGGTLLFTPAAAPWFAAANRRDR